MHIYIDTCTQINYFLEMNQNRLNPESTETMGCFSFEKLVDVRCHNCMGKLLICSAIVIIMQYFNSLYMPPQNKSYDISHLFRAH